jgi:hypothetical protein
MEWLQSKLDEVITLPHEAILLRWTAAIKEKAEKLLGNADKGIAGYIDKGVVGAEDSFYIAQRSEPTQSSRVSAQEV